MSVDMAWLEREVLKRELTEDERDALQCVQVHSYKAWEKIIEQNQPGGTLYIFRSGKASVEDTNGENRVCIADIEEGTMFGEMSFMSDDKTTAEVISKEACVVYQISRADFSALMRDQQALAYTIMCQIFNNQANIIREMNSQLIPILYNLKKKANSLPLFVKLFPLFFIVAYMLAFFYISWKDFSY